MIQNPKSGNSSPPPPSQLPFRPLPEVNKHDHLFHKHKLIQANMIMSLSEKFHSCPLLKH